MNADCLPSRSALESRAVDSSTNPRSDQRACVRSREVDRFLSQLLIFSDLDTIACDLPHVSTLSTTHPHLSSSWDLFLRQNISKLQVALKKNRINLFLVTCRSRPSAGCLLPSQRFPLVSLAVSASMRQSIFNKIFLSMEAAQFMVRPFFAQETDVTLTFRRTSLF